MDIAKNGSLSIKSRTVPILITNCFIQLELKQIRSKYENYAMHEFNNS